MQTQIRCHRMWHQIWVYNVCIKYRYIYDRRKNVDRIKMGTGKWIQIITGTHKCWALMTELNEWEMYIMNVLNINSLKELNMLGWLIVLGFNDTSTLVVILCHLPEKGRKEIVEEIKGQGRKRNRNESEETAGIKTFPLYPYLLQGQQALPNCKPISVGRPGDVSYTTHLPHLTTPHTSGGFSAILTRETTFVTT